MNAINLISQIVLLRKKKGSDDILGEVKESVINGEQMTKLLLEVANSMHFEIFQIHFHRHKSIAQSLFYF